MILLERLSLTQVKHERASNASSVGDLVMSRNRLILH
jgi:hypothetical protein